jgi:hypothetical protein
VPEVTSGFPRAWVEFPDPANAEQIIRADLTWLTSRYNCIYGRGCRSIDAGIPYGGCCTHGAHFADKADEKRVRGWVQQLTQEDWQRQPKGRVKNSDWIDRDADGDRKTAVADGACVFLNNPDFEQGAGCALHVLAQRLGRSHVETKPDVCWQLPIRRDYDWREENDGERHLVVTITEYTRAMWGAGGHDFHWYCSSDTDAHNAAEPVYRNSRDELVALIGDRAYAQLIRHCEAHEAARAALSLTPIGDSGLAPHPAD